MNIVIELSALDTVRLVASAVALLFVIWVIKTDKPLEPGDHDPSL